MRRCLAGLPVVHSFWRGARLRAWICQLADCSWLASALELGVAQQDTWARGFRVLDHLPVVPPHLGTRTSRLGVAATSNARTRGRSAGELCCFPLLSESRVALVRRRRIFAEPKLRFHRLLHSVLHYGVRSAWGTR